MSERTNIETVVGCPFCGETPTVGGWYGGCGDDHMVACSNAACHVAPTAIGATSADAIRLWNTRKSKTHNVPDTELYALADACRLLVAAIEQINGKCQTREQRAALGVGRAALASLQRLEHDLRDGDTTREGEQ